MNKTVKTTVSSSQIGESYIKVLHKSGLTLLLKPMPEYSSVFALFATKYGSVNSTFKTDRDDDYITIPDGMAHFLEHKLFEGEVEDAFVSYSRTGANANAYTSFDKTAYLFSATEKVNESLEILLNFVTHPYFTEETVAKEQGIIGQEIKMYDDDPNWCASLNLLKALFWEHPIRVDIAGSVESIAEITPEILYRTYNTFYNLSNMVLSIAGNFDVDEVIALCDKHLVPCEQITIDNKPANEPQDIFMKKIEKKLEVAMPVFEIGFKEKPQNQNVLKAQLTNEILLDILFGESSDFYERLYNDGTINSTFGCEVMAGDGYLINILGGEAPDPEKVYSEIKKEIERAKTEGIDRELFEITKKAFYGGRISKFGNVESAASGMMNAHFMDCDVFESLKIISELTLEDIEDSLSKQLFEKYSSISVITPM